MKRILLGLTTLYVAVEFQSLLFLLNTFNQVLNSDILSQQEKFGYASAGIGLSLVLSRYLFSKIRIKNFYIKFFVLLLLLPMFYIPSVWLIYDNINKTPEYIPESAKPKAMYISAAILTHPKETPFYAFYFEQKEKLPNIDWAAFAKKHALTDRNIQQLYLNGLRFIYLYHKTLNQTIKTQSNEDLLKLIQTTQIEKNASNTPYEAIYLLDQALNSSDPWVEQFTRFMMLTSKLPLFNTKQDLFLDFPQLVINEWFFETPINQKYLLETLTLNQKKQIYHSVINYLNLDRERLISKDTQLFSLIRDEYTRFSIAPFVQFRDQINLDYQYDNKIDQNGLFLQVVQQNAPFFFENDKPNIPLSTFYQKKNLDKSERVLLTKLPTTIKKQWEHYYTQTLKALSLDKSAWANKTNYNINKSYLKISTVLPILLVLSIVLIIVNLYSLRHHIGYLAVSLTLIVFVGLEQDNIVVHYLVDLLVRISVHEPTIFLH